MTRSLAINALVRSGLKDKRLTSALEGVLRDDADPSVRASAAEALGKLIGAEAVPPQSRR